MTQEVGKYFTLEDIEDVKLRREQTCGNII
jgi:hypothetical protein